MKKFFLPVLFILIASYVFGQDSINIETFDASQYSDATNEKKYCTQKVINQTPTKLIGVAYEHQLGFTNKAVISKFSSSDEIKGMGGVRTQINILAISTNKLILNVGTTYWGSKVNTDAKRNGSIGQVYQNTMHIEGLNALLFKPLNEKNFIIAQANTDASYVGHDNDWRFTKAGITVYGSAIYGWKKGDYRMWGVGVSRTYRLGRPLIVPILFYNQTFNEQWGVEALLPARAHVRYNFSTNSMLLAGFELEGQQFDLSKNSEFLQRGEIKPRIMIEKKLYKFYWLSAQVGYRINGRFNFVSSYDGSEKMETLTNNWGAGTPYFNIGVYFVSP